ncbi:hypothetical protein GYMLUDRAFT_42315 [Collybiopsis luxurians FD-317 M1]|uniref:Uncharacterized protein n=1 Tax=Collybiopsis luxurians FD-317 M1 TaxID=944289 RepID=A0A0D0C162_9AGAR|nr:hypothetical protein GYMLUDRAFT_42315 [Collybiopsis luxurians FD-317 M1]
MHIHWGDTSLLLTPTSFEYLNAQGSHRQKKTFLNLTEALANLEKKKVPRVYSIVLKPNHSISKRKNKRYLCRLDRRSDSTCSSLAATANIGSTEATGRSTYVQHSLPTHISPVVGVPGWKRKAQRPDPTRKAYPRFQRYFRGVLRDKSWIISGGALLSW